MKRSGGILLALLLIIMFMATFFESRRAQKHAVPLLKTTVLVRALIQADGRVTEAVPVKDDGLDENLRQTALDMVFGSTFTPAEGPNGPVPVWMVIPVEFLSNTEGSAPPQFGKVKRDES